MKLLRQSIDDYGTALLNYAQSLCRHNTVDADALFDDLFIYALERFQTEKINNFGALRFKLYQLFVDRYRAEKSNPVKAVEELPERSGNSTREAFSQEEEKELMSSFFTEHAPDISDQDKHLLWQWARLGLTYEELSQETGIPVSTVGDRITRARESITSFVNSQMYQR